MSNKERCWESNPDTDKTEYCILKPGHDGDHDFQDFTQQEKDFLKHAQNFLGEDWDAKSCHFRGTCFFEYHQNEEWIEHLLEAHLEAMMKISSRIPQVSDFERVLALAESVAKERKLEVKEYVSLKFVRDFVYNVEELDKPVCDFCFKEKALEGKRNCRGCQLKADFAEERFKQRVNCHSLK